MAGYILVGSNLEVYKDHGILVEKGKISQIAENEKLKRKYKQHEIFDARDKIVIPGFINSHMHMYGILSHGIELTKIPKGFYEFLKEIWWPRVEDKLTKELIISATKIACLEMIRSGITTFFDVLEAPNSIPGVLEIEMEEVKKAGLRAILSFEATERLSSKNGLMGLEENYNFIKRCEQEEGLIKGMMCIHTTFTCSGNFIKLAKNKADELGSMIHFHLEESEYETNYCKKRYGMTPLNYYNMLGVLDQKVLASQVVNTDREGIELIKKRGVNVSHMPLSNCEVGGGIAPVPDMVESGITVGIGTDGYINNFFEVMRATSLIHKGYRRNPSILPSNYILKMATINGAKILGFNNIGTFDKGKSADITVLKNSFNTPITKKNLIDQIVLFANPHYVDSVFVNGNVLMKNGELMTLDEEKVINETRLAAEKLWVR